MIKTGAAALALAAWAFAWMTFGLFIAADHDDISDGFANSIAGPTTRDCRDIPASALGSQAIVETSRDKTHRREIYTFTDLAQSRTSDRRDAGGVPALIVYEGERPTGCPPAIQPIFDSSPLR